MWRPRGIAGIASDDRAVRDWAEMFTMWPTKYTPGLRSQLAVAPDGSWLATGGADTTVRIWDPITGNCRHVLLHGIAVGRLAVSPAGDWLAAGYNFFAGVWSVAAGPRRCASQASR